MTEPKPMKISEWIKHLEWQLDNYGDGDVRVDWGRHEQLHQDQVFFNRVIGNHEVLNNKSIEELQELKSNPTDNDGLWIQNYPY